jgi:hypothetical protein
MTNAQVLYSATVAPSSWMKSNTGKIKVGYNSDLVLLVKNPLEDIKNTKTIEYVFFDKYRIDKIHIYTIFKAIEDANNKNRNIAIDHSFFLHRIETLTTNYKGFGFFFYYSPHLAHIIIIELQKAINNKSRTILAAKFKKRKKGRNFIEKVAVRHCKVFF